MSKNTTTTPAEIIDSLTVKGRETMTAVGNWTGSFFDGGCVPGSGIWGSIFVQEMGQKSSGVINRLRDLGLFDVTPDQEGDAGDWWSLTTLGVDVARALALTTVTEQAEGAASTADEAAAAEFTAEPLTEAERAVDATKDWRGNYNTVFAPAAEEIAQGYKGVEVTTVNVSTMLKQTDIAGPLAKEFLDLLVAVEAAALSATKTWQKTLDRKDASDMEKYNQNRSFLAGYLGVAAQRQTGAKKIPVIAFAKDMDRAVRPEALKAGAAAARSEV